jgi:hypothetical protein
MVWDCVVWNTAPQHVSTCRTQATLRALEVLGHKAGGLDGCGGMYVNAIPAELDCNARRRNALAQPTHGCR